MARSMARSMVPSLSVIRLLNVVIVVDVLNRRPSTRRTSWQMRSTISTHSINSTLSTAPVSISTRCSPWLENPWCGAQRIPHTWATNYSIRRFGKHFQPKLERRRRRASNLSILFLKRTVKLSGSDPWESWFVACDTISIRRRGIPRIPCWSNQVPI